MDAAGLPEDVAERLARATVEGSGALLARESGTSPAQLRVNVTSPGGTTAAALDILMAPGAGAFRLNCQAEDFAPPNACAELRSPFIAAAHLMQRKRPVGHCLGNSRARAGAGTRGQFVLIFWN